MKIVMATTVMRVRMMTRSRLRMHDTGLREH